MLGAKCVLQGVVYKVRDANYATQSACYKVNVEKQMLQSIRIGAIIGAASKNATSELNVTPP